MVEFQKPEPLPATAGSADFTKKADDVRHSIRQNITIPKRSKHHDPAGYNLSVNDFRKNEMVETRLVQNFTAVGGTGKSSARKAKSRA